MPRREISYHPKENEKSEIVTRVSGKTIWTSFEDDDYITTWFYKDHKQLVQHIKEMLYVTLTSHQNNRYPQNRTLHEAIEDFCTYLEWVEEENKEEA